VARQTGRPAESSLSICSSVCLSLMLFMSHATKSARRCQKRQKTA